MMLWYKTWLETRWRFLIGLLVLLCSAAGVVLQYPMVVKLMGQMPPVEMKGEIGRRIQEAVELSRQYRGFVWSHGFRQNLVQIGTLFAVLLGTGGVLLQSSGSGTLFTLSLPVSRRRVLGGRVAAGLGQRLLLALIPALLVPLLSPFVGERYDVASALAHALCLFVAGAVFFSLAVLLSTLFGDLWRPLLVALLVAVVIGVAEQFVLDPRRFGLFAVMSGETFFRTGRLPWLGLLASAALASVLLIGADRNLARRDF
jgi:hypothetical protein